MDQNNQRVDQDIALIENRVPPTQNEENSNEEITNHAKTTHDLHGQLHVDLPFADTNLFELNNSSNNEVDSSVQVVQEISSPHNSTLKSPRPVRDRHQPAYLKDYVALAIAPTSHSPHLAEPKTFKSALKDSRWIEAMQEEIKALHDNNTWALVSRPSNVNVVGSKWVFRIKYKENGSVDRFKARLVAQGFTQVSGVDYDETFSPVVKATTICLVIALSLSHNWSMRQLDVKNAFLHGHLKETVYMEQPLGFVDQSIPDHVCLLKKSLYGLKQAPRAWFDRLSQFLLHLGFTCSKADPSLFVYRSSTITVLLLIYVDDILVIGNNDGFISKLIDQLSTEFAIKDLGALRYFLGIEIKPFPGGIFLSQQKYIHDLLQRTQMLQSTQIATPMVLKDSFTKSDNEPVDPFIFRSIVGALQYLTFTRPDIAHAVNRVCQFFSNPTQAHLKAAKRILRYLKGTQSFGLRYLSNSSTSLYGFSDADWAGCPTTR
ncbi:hypothetical protein LWI29_012417 [Acer saccharum]|uniref:Reverse transcriptase Ty1/copia-type domain-containing protein n=1 Tax=Acer saccharum TaxID=4024 RepID=A0AA39RW99_ACESA|nr:hypothetical protein LWI29_012417 [Acer saccharum]